MSDDRGPQGENEQSPAQPPPAPRLRPVSPVRLYVTLFIAWLLIIVGFSGVVLPILPGFVFLIAGVSMLATVSPRAARLLARLRARHPLVAETADAAHRRMRQILRRLGLRR